MVRTAIGRRRGQAGSPIMAPARSWGPRLAASLLTCSPSAPSPVDIQRRLSLGSYAAVADGRRARASGEGVHARPCQLGHGRRARRRKGLHRGRDPDAGRAAEDGTPRSDGRRSGERASTRRRTSRSITGRRTCIRLRRRSTSSRSTRGDHPPGLRCGCRLLPRLELPPRAARIRAGSVARWSSGRSGMGLGLREELVSILREAGVRTLVDARRFPGSRHNPQFSQPALRGCRGGPGSHIDSGRLGGRRAGQPGEERARLPSRRDSFPAVPPAWAPAAGRRRWPRRWRPRLPASCARRRCGGVATDA